ncbi:hypothetical protein ACOMHN_056841 [Nucella lapillus]
MNEAQKRKRSLFTEAAVNNPHLEHIRYHELCSISIRVLGCEFHRLHRSSAGFAQSGPEGVGIMLGPAERTLAGRVTYIDLQVERTQFTAI